jgi:hypothetical protein
MYESQLSVYERLFHQLSENTLHVISMSRLLSKK